MVKIRGQTSAGEIRITDFDRDDDDISGGEIHQVVICLNYVWDAGNSKWVRMTQP